MKVFYGVLAAIYISWFIWYGGSGEPVTPQELNTYISAMKEKSSSGSEKQAETEMLMRRLAEFDTGDEFLMINLMKYRKKYIFPNNNHAPW